MTQATESAPLEAGRKAISDHAWRTAYELFKEADEQESLGAVDLEALADAAWWSGRLEDCISARERAYAAHLGSDSPRRAAAVALRLADDYFSKLAHSIGAGWFNRAERLLESEPECVEHGDLWIMRAHGALVAGDHDAAIEAAQKSLDIGTRFGNRDLQAYGLLFEGKALVTKGEVDRGLPMLDEATVAAVGGELGPYASGIVYCVAISTTAEMADYNRAGQWTEASTRWCERQSISGFPGICRVHRAEIMRLRGSWLEAEQEARRALSELQNFNLQFAGEGFYELGEVRLHMGDLPGAEDAFRQAHELGRTPQPGLGLLRLAEGKPDAAFSSIRRALDDPSLDRLHRARLIPGLVETALTVGEIDVARAAVEEFEEIVKTYDSAALQASTLCTRGALELAEGHARAAIASLQQSVKLWREADLPYEGARARMALGAALEADGDEDGARFELQAARKKFEELGAVIDLRRVCEMLGDDVGKGVPKASGPVVRMTKTFMFTDIVGSTKLAEAFGDDAWGNLLGWHDQTLRRLIADHRGEEVKQVGDGFFAAFDSSLDAIECAVDIQKHLAEHGKTSGFAPQVRIGLHTADAARKGGDYEGKGVHAAARIGALAQGGEVLVSEDVAAGSRFPISELRAVRLKGIDKPVKVATLVTG